MIYALVGLFGLVAGFALCAWVGANDPTPEQLEAAEARAEKWKDAARLLGEELKKYKPEAPHD